MRMPISARRCVTEKASTPYTPTIAIRNATAAKVESSTVLNRGLAVNLAHGFVERLHFGEEPGMVGAHFLAKGSRHGRLPPASVRTRKRRSTVPAGEVSLTNASGMAGWFNPWFLASAITPTTVFHGPSAASQNLLAERALAGEIGAGGGLIDDCDSVRVMNGRRLEKKRPSTSREAGGLQVVRIGAAHADAIAAMKWLRQRPVGTRERDRSGPCRQAACTAVSAAASVPGMRRR